MRLRPPVPELAIALAALAVASAFAATVLRHAPALALPLDDAYAYLTQARQLGRGELPPAGPGSVLWPLLLAPCWVLGARGEALVWVSFGLCAALHAATCVGCYRLARELAGALAGLAAAALVLAVMPLAHLALAGVEVALASALLVWTLLLYVRARKDGPPSRALALCAAATALATPEAAVLAALAAGLALADRLQRRCWRDAAWWAALLAAPALWLLLSAGEPAPPPGEASWVSAARSHVLGGDGGPFGLEGLTLALWLVGALRVLAWAKRARRRAAGLLVAAAPLVLVGASIASMEVAGPRGARAIAPAIPLLLVGVACVLAPPARAALAGARWVRLGRPLAAAALAALWWWAGARALRLEPVRYARAAVDLDRQAGQIGRYVRRELPGASILAHEAGAISYHGDVRVSPLLGAGEAADQGPGALFELLERLPPERRPTHLASGARWPDPVALFGAVVLETFPARPPPRGHGGGLRLHAASWDLAHTAERPLDAVPGWRVVDRVDVADLADERGHRHAGASGRRTVLHREVRSTGLALDGGRTISGEERFTIELDPARPVRLLLRTGGPGPPDHDQIVRPATVTVSTSAGSASATIAPPTGVLVEVAFELPVPAAREVKVHIAANGPYRAFHWFALQPE
jgi:hypothetical protein